MRMNWTELGQLCGVSGQYIGTHARRKGISLGPDRKTDVEEVLKLLGRHQDWKRLKEENPKLQDRQSKKTLIQTEGGKSGFLCRESPEGEGTSKAKRNGSP